MHDQKCSLYENEKRLQVHKQHIISYCHTFYFCHTFNIFSPDPEESYSVKESESVTADDTADDKLEAAVSSRIEAAGKNFVQYLEYFCRSNAT